MRAFCFSVLCFIAVAGFCDTGVEYLKRAERPTHAPSTVAEAIERLRSTRQGTRVSVIRVESTDSAFLIPVAGNTQGAAGTYFRSDIAFRNERPVTQRISVAWLAQGANNCGGPLLYFELSPNSVTSTDDFVGTTLEKTGIGAILVMAVDTAGNPDTGALIDGYSRIWTPQPGSEGTVSQNFTAVSITDSLGNLTATLMGLKQNSQFRANVGVVNLDTAAAHNWTFQSVFNDSVTSLTVQPCSVGQVGAVPGSGSSSGNLAFRVNADGSGFWWSGFGSSTDNVTGDGWVSRAIQ